MIRKKIFGEDHAHVATSYYNQATTLVPCASEREKRDKK